MASIKLYVYVNDATSTEAKRGDSVSILGDVVSDGGYYHLRYDTSPSIVPLGGYAYTRDWLSSSVSNIVVLDFKMPTPPLSGVIEVWRYSAAGVSKAAEATFNIKYPTVKQSTITKIEVRANKTPVGPQDTVKVGDLVEVYAQVDVRENAYYLFKLTADGLKPLENERNINVGVWTVPIAYWTESGAVGGHALKLEMYTVYAATIGELVNYLQDTETGGYTVAAKTVTPTPTPTPKPTPTPTAPQEPEGITAPLQQYWYVPAAGAAGLGFLYLLLSRRRGK